MAGVKMNPRTKKAKWDDGLDPLAAKVATEMVETGKGQTFRLATREDGRQTKAVTANRNNVIEEAKRTFVAPILGKKNTYRVRVNARPSQFVTLKDWAEWGTEVLCTIFAALLVERRPDIQKRQLAIEIMYLLSGGDRAWQGLESDEAAPFVDLPELISVGRGVNGTIHFGGDEDMKQLTFEITAPSYLVAVSSAVVGMRTLYHAQVRVDEKEESTVNSALFNPGDDLFT